jgi:hypothetical protein
MSSVSADPTGRKPHHHGALHSALIEASIALAREGGPDRVILREAARRPACHIRPPTAISPTAMHWWPRCRAFARNELAAEMRRLVSGQLPFLVTEQG